jgi:hypothetical protein
MRSRLEQLIAQLDALKTFVESHGSVMSIFTDYEDEDEDVQEYIALAKRYHYAAFAVILYISLEQFVNGLIFEYAPLEAHRAPYSELSPERRIMHRKDWHKFFENGRLITRGCIKVPFLNKSFYDSEDWDAEEFDDAFKIIGIDSICKDVCKTCEMITWHRTQNDKQQNTLNRKVVEHRLRDIILSRNNIADRRIPDELPSVENMLESANFIKSLAVSICEIVTRHYLGIRYANSENSFRLKPCEGSFPNNSRNIIVADKPAARIFAGQPVFVMIRSAVARWGRIQRWRSQKADAGVLGGVKITLDFDFPDSGGKLIALKKDDHNLWKPKRDGGQSKHSS